MMRLKYVSSSLQSFHYQQKVYIMKFLVIDTYGIAYIHHAESYHALRAWCRESDILPVTVRVLEA